MAFAADGGFAMARQRHKTAENVEKRVARARFVVKRVNGQVEAEFGGRFMHVRGTIKVKCHLMFGILVLAIDQIFRLETFRPAPARPTVTAIPLPAAANHSLDEFCKRLSGELTPD
jgi:hypothetical protein